MNQAWPLGVVTATIAAALVASCGPKRVQPALAPGQAQVALFPDPDDGAVGHADVSTASGAVDHAAARESTTASPNQPPAPPTVLREADAKRLFGDVLSTLPAAPQRFSLYFRFESDELTEQSRALVPKVLAALRNHPFPDVAVIGHTDTMGSAASNFELGLRRANAIRALLVEAGVRPDLIEVTSHGEADQLVKTRNGVPEPRNRRVEITVR